MKIKNMRTDATEGWPAAFCNCDGCRAARRLGGRPERTLVFEDALHAARTAKAAGFLVCGVYDPSAAEDQAELRALSDWYLPRLDDPEFLSRLQQTED